MKEQRSIMNNSRLQQVTGFWVFLCSVAISSVCLATPLDSVRKANELYSQKHFAEASRLYESVLQQGLASSSLYYNLGNSYYKQDKIALAILNYERALQLNPGDPNTQYNLELAKTFILDRIESVPEFFLYRWYQNLCASLSPDQWGSLALILFIFGILFGAIFLFSRVLTQKRLSFWFGSLFIVFAFLFVFFAYNRRSDLLTHKEAIITSPTVTGKSIPEEQGESLFVLHEGLKVLITRTSVISPWVEIKLPNGERGWLPDSVLIRI